MNTTRFFNELFINARLISIFLIDKNGYILEANEGVNLNLGYDIEKLRGQHFRILYTDEDQQNKLPEKELESVISTGSSKDINYIMHSSGQKLWSTGETILVEEDNKQELMIKMVHDISREKELEDHLYKRNKELETLNRDLDNFIYTASHDLKAPINNMEGLINALQETLGEAGNTASSTAINLVEMIKKSVRNFKTTLRDLTDTNTYKEQLQDAENIQTVSFQEIMDNLLTDIRDIVQKKKAKIHTDFSEAPEIRFVKKNIRSILYNLISNSLKYSSPERQPELSIETSELEEGYIRIIVKDNGIGIPEEDFDKVFSKYGRAHPKLAEGTGIGMSIVSSIVNNAGGKLDLHSEVGKGTVFTIYLPESSRKLGD